MKNNITMAKIDRELGVVEKIVPQTIDVENYSPTINEDDLENDYEYQRKQFYNLVEKGSNAIDGILELAKESEHPRTYEVAGQLIKNVAEVTEKLGDLQKKMKELKKVPNNAPKTVLQHDSHSIHSICVSLFCNWR